MITKENMLWNGLYQTPNFHAPNLMHKLQIIMSFARSLTEMSGFLLLNLVWLVLRSAASESIQLV